MSYVWYNILMIKQCLICGTDITIIWPKSGQKYCSSKCQQIGQRNITKKSQDSIPKRRGLKCPKCGGYLSYGGIRKQAKQCQKCYLASMHGEYSPRWNGGRKIDRNGYVLIYHPEPHPRRIEHTRKNPKWRITYYVAEHILNWEKANGRYLPEGYTVHHLNGIKDDNRPKNLVALPHHSHSSGMLNEELRKRIRELEGIISQSKFPL